MPGIDVSFHLHRGESGYTLHFVQFTLRHLDLVLRIYRATETTFFLSEIKISCIWRLIKAKMQQKLQRRAIERKI